MKALILYILAAINTMTDTQQIGVVSPAKQKAKALTELKWTLEHRQKFIKAHAAEYLIWTGHSDIALQEYKKQERLHSTEPKYRIVVWRVLAQAEKSERLKNSWINKIYDAYKDMGGPDRTHATETLAKLKQPVNSLFPQETAATLVSTDRPLQLYAIWGSSYGSPKKMTENRAQLLQIALTDTNTIARKISAYALRKDPGLNIDQWNKLANAALAVAKDDEMYVSLLATAVVTAPSGANPKTLDVIAGLFTQGVAKYNASGRIDLAQALAEKGTQKDVPLLMDLMDGKYTADIYDPGTDEAADVRAAAAYAILKIYSKHK